LKSIRAYPSINNSALRPLRSGTAFETIAQRSPYQLLFSSIPTRMQRANSHLLRNPKLSLSRCLR
jgi:hypothetical protein